MQKLSLLLICALFFCVACAHSIERDDGAMMPEAVNAPETKASGSMQELVFHALAFLGVKYRFGGTDPQTGWDCSGYVSHVFKNAIGLTLPRTSFSMSERGDPIERNDLQPGDLVFFNTLKRAFSHVGIYLGDNRFIHAPSSGKAVQISDMNAVYWAKRFDGGRRIVAEK